MSLSRVLLLAAAGLLLVAGGTAAVLLRGEGAADAGGGGATAAPSPGSATPRGGEGSPAPTPLVRDGRFVGQGVIVPVPDSWSVDRANLPAGQVIVRPGDLIDSQRIVAADDLLTSPHSTLQGDSLSDLVRQVRRTKDAKPVVDKPLKFKGAVRAHQLVYETTPRQGGGATPTPGGATPSPDGATPTSGPPIRELMILAESSDGQFALFYYRALQTDYQKRIARSLRNRAGLDPNSEPSRERGTREPAG